jgi:hypothetical protein
MGVKIDELIPDSKISDELIPNGSVEPVPIDFIPYGTHSNLFQMDVSDLFSPPAKYDTRKTCFQN